MNPTAKRFLSTLRVLHHDNPLGLPHRGEPPMIPRRGLPPRRGIPHVKKVVAVASVNLAFSLAARERVRVGVLDLDIFGPSIPKLLGLESAGEPHLTSTGALIPLTNHGLLTMSIGFLFPNADAPVTWRGLMVQKAVQQLLFDVDWRGADPHGPGLDVLVIDMPPGTGDVPLSLGQLVNVHGAVIVSTPQDVALADVRKGIAAFQRLSIPIIGLVLNQSYFICPSCSTPHHLFGSSDASKGLGIKLLGELPLAPGVSSGGDAGLPYALLDSCSKTDGVAGQQWQEAMLGVTKEVWEVLHPEYVSS
ncbi:P-loop containing nucleoside triphosphate hydrolase protein [Multifurca ochricompacta]|uniref:P-loop containing nucleoside triphosphate hydrolase protein n=1 Tax=Multifurca ochricompacta TaxID=376703 RepID=A0AAD4M2M3_9AGAM|nr:P-loop containing nucleoside triphosphate hydrolase protein [Multifurca ochricompacta]